MFRSSLRKTKTVHVVLLVTKSPGAYVAQHTTTPDPILGKQDPVQDHRQGRI